MTDQKIIESGVRWKNESARKMYDHLEKDLKQLAVSYGLAAPDWPEDVSAAALAKLPRTRVNRSPDAHALAQRDYQLASKPIVDEMMRLRSIYTTPFIVIEKE